MPEAELLTRTDSSQSAREERGCRTDKNETIKKTENAIPTGAASHTRAHRMDRKNSASCTKYREKRARRNEKNSQNEKKKKREKKRLGAYTYCRTWNFPKEWGVLLRGLGIRTDVVRMSR